MQINVESRRVEPNRYLLPALKVQERGDADVAQVLHFIGLIQDCSVWIV